MKIAFFTRSLPFHRLGGMEEITWDLATALAAAGQDVSVVTTAITNHDGPFTEQAVTIIPLSCPGGRYSRAWWHESRQYYLKNKNYIDIIFSVSAGADAIAPLKNRAPVIRQCHGTSWGEIVTKIKVHSIRSLASLVLKSPLGLFREIAIYKHYDAIVAVGEMVEHYLKSFPTDIGTERSRIELIPNGVSEKRFAFSQDARDQIRRQYDWSADAKVMLFLARLHREKGIFETLDCFRKWRETEPNAKMLIVGDGPDREAVTQYISRYQIAGATVMTGRVQRSDVAEYLSAADVFLFLTKRNEGLPLNILEALANGLPVICSDHLTGLPDNLQKVVINDIDNITELCHNLISERSWTSKLPDENTINYCVRQYLQLFDQLIEERSNII